MFAVVNTRSSVSVQRNIYKAEAPSNIIQKEIKKNICKVLVFLFL